MQFSGSKKGRQAKLPAVPEQIRKDWPAKWPGSGRNAAGFVQKLSAYRPEGCFRAAAAAETAFQAAELAVWCSMERRLGTRSAKKFSGESACGIASISSLRHSVPQKIPGTVADGRLALWIDANFAEIAEFAKSVHTGTLQLEKKAVYYR